MELDAPPDIERRDPVVLDQFNGGGDAEQAKGEACVTGIGGALVEAGANRGEEFVRTYSPINVRELVDQAAGCCLCISFACTGAAPADGTDFWCQAREVSNQLKIARSDDAVMLGSAVIARHFPVDADCDTVQGDNVQVPVLLPGVEVTV